MQIVLGASRPQEGGMIGSVATAGIGGFGVVGPSRIDSPVIFAPRGVSYLPAAGDSVLLLPINGRDICLGVVAPTTGLEPGEIRLTSAGGASITLTNTGEILLNGAEITRDGRVIGR